MANYADRIEDILTNAEQYHEAYYRAGTFSGPSLYFHRRALDTRTSENKLQHLEYVYATLVSWGMHRMGLRGSKMQDFATFHRSVEPLGDQIAQTQRFTMGELNAQQWALLKSIFHGTRIMASGTSLVGNSKVMHHMMPNVVPPIDREYTLIFLRGNKNIRNNLDSEWETMREIMASFFIPVASNEGFLQKANNWMASPQRYPWDTSLLKIIDNRIIGARKAMNEFLG